jgi:hypothetical protein
MAACSFLLLFSCLQASTALLPLLSLLQICRRNNSRRNKILTGNYPSGRMIDTPTTDYEQVIGESGHQQPDNQHSYVLLSYLSLANGCNVRRSHTVANT